MSLDKLRDNKYIALSTLTVIAEAFDSSFPAPITYFSYIESIKAVLIIFCVGVFQLEAKWIKIFGQDE